MPIGRLSFIRHPMNHMPRRHMLTGRLAMTFLVIEKNICAKIFQKLSLIQAT